MSISHGDDLLWSSSAAESHQLAESRTFQRHVDAVMVMPGHSSDIGHLTVVAPNITRFLTLSRVPSRRHAWSVTVERLQKLSSAFPELTELECPSIDVDCLSQMASSFPYLCQLSVDQQFTVAGGLSRIENGAEMAEHLATCRQLKALALPVYGSLSLQLDQWANLVDRMKLIKFDIGNNGDAHLFMRVPQMPTLTHLSLSFRQLDLPLHLLRDSFFPLVPARMPSLVHLSVYYGGDAPSVRFNSLPLIAEFRSNQTLPQLQSLTIGTCAAEH